MLQQLGINPSVLIQFTIFVITFYLVIQIAYKPYTDAYLTRIKNTKGSEEIADDIQKKSIELHSEYSIRAKEIHGKISEIFSKTKAEASFETEKILKTAKTEAEAIVDLNRKNINSKFQQLEKELNDMKDGIVIAINNKLLGK